MAYTNVLNMLDLAGLPVRAEERLELSPIIVAGGTCAFNPEPLAPFVDIFVPGRGGGRVAWSCWSCTARPESEGWDKEEFLPAAAQIPGLYVPSLYDISYHEDGTVAAITPREGAPGGGDQADRPGLQQVLLPGEDHCALHRDHPGQGDPGGVPGLHPGLPVLSGGVRLPAGPVP